MASTRFFHVISLLVLLLTAAGWARPAQAAAAVSERDVLIAEINALRASRGLAPYTVDSGLMALAQEHSAYQASIRSSTHLHSDGRMPPDLGVVENVAAGDIGWINARIAVYEIWADTGHLRTMIAFASGAMGVGVADDGKTAYYTLEVRPSEASATQAGPGPGFTVPVSSGTLVPSATAPAPAGAAAINPAVLVYTPQPDGAMVHVVAYGETLWTIAIAYGVTISQIREWNNLPQDSNNIIEGARLIVRPASPTTTPAPTLPPPAASPTAPAPSETPAVAPALSVATAPASAEPLPTRVEAAETAAEVTTEAGTGANAQPGDPASSTRGGSFAPVIAGVIILFGGALFMVGLALKPRYTRHW